MAQLGDKVAAKEVARKVNCHIDSRQQQKLEKIEDVESEAARIGFPVMLKAASGGGGRGMRVVRKQENLAKSFREARTSHLPPFGDDTIFIEKIY